MGLFLLIQYSAVRSQQSLLQQVFDALTFGITVVWIQGIVNVTQNQLALLLGNSLLALLVAGGISGLVAALGEFLSGILGSSPSLKRPIIALVFIGIGTMAGVGEVISLVTTH